MLKAECEVAGRAFQDEQPVRARVQGERKRVALGFAERGGGEKSLHLTLRENRSRLILTNQSKQIRPRPSTEPWLRGRTGMGWGEQPPPHSRRQPL